MAKDAGVTPLLFFKAHPRIFFMTTESGPGLNSHLKGGAF